MTARRRAWWQFVESCFIVGVLFAFAEMLVPQVRVLSWQADAVLLCFGFCVIVAHTIAAYVRPPEHDEAAERIEQAIYVQVEELRRFRSAADFERLKRWQHNDPTWSRTSPEHHAVRVMSTTRYNPLYPDHTQTTLPEQQAVHAGQQQTTGYQKMQRSPGK